MSVERGFGTAVVRGRSMAPTLSDGDLLLISYGRIPKPGQLVLVRLPGGRPLSVKRAAHQTEDGWWIERDNPSEGVDSWVVGAIPDRDIVAVVRCRLWPPRPMRRWRGPATKPS